MAKSLGNISYSEIVKNRDKVIRREGISKDIFEKLMQSMNICGFENDDANITVYFNADDIKEFDSVANSFENHFDFKKINDRLNSFDDKLLQICDLISKSKSEKAWEEDIKIINERLDSVVEYVSEYCSIINEIKDSIKGNNTGSKTSIVEVDGCSRKMDELMEKFDSLYGDMIRNMAYLRSDLKIKIGKKSIPKWKRTFFILISCLFITVVLVILQKFCPR